MDLSQWCTSIGSFNLRLSGCVDREFISSINNVVLLHTVVTVMRDVAVLQTYMYVVTVLLLLLCGDIETNPCPTVTKVCPNCIIHYIIRMKLYTCGYVFIRNVVEK